MTDCRTQLTFDFHPRKDVVADFDGGLISTDSGLLPIRQLDERLGWSAAVADILDDSRQARGLIPCRPPAADTPAEATRRLSTFPHSAVVFKPLAPAARPRVPAAPAILSNGDNGNRLV